MCIKFTLDIHCIFWFWAEQSVFPLRDSKLCSRLCADSQSVLPLVNSIWCIHHVHQIHHGHLLRFLCLTGHSVLSLRDYCAITFDAFDQIVGVSMWIKYIMGMYCMFFVWRGKVYCHCAIQSYAQKLAQKNTQIILTLCNFIWCIL